MRLILALTLLCLLLSGCHQIGSLRYGQAGYFSAYDEAPGHMGSAIELGVDVHTFGSRGVAAGGGLTLRVKRGEELFQVAIGEDYLLLFTSRVRTLTPFVRGGLNVMQFESVDGRFAFGMFSPSAEVGLMIRLWTADDEPTRMGQMERRGRRSVMLVLSATTEYDLRFGSAHDNRGYWGLRLGIVRSDEVSRIFRPERTEAR